MEISTVELQTCFGSKIFPPLFPFYSYGEESESSYEGSEFWYPWKRRDGYGENRCWLTKHEGKKREEKRLYHSCVGVVGVFVHYKK